MPETDVGTADRGRVRELDLQRQRVRTAYVFLIPMLIMLALVAA